MPTPVFEYLKEIKEVNTSFGNASGDFCKIIGCCSRIRKVL